MADKIMPKVSIIIPTHNRADLLFRSVNSVINQTYKQVEIIIINDGSSDNTEEVIKNLQKKHQNIVYLKNDKPQGAPASRNLGISKASGEFVSFFDDDDEMLPHKIELQLNLYSDRYAYVGSGNKRVLFNNKSKITIPQKIITLNSILYRNTTGIPILTRKERILSIGGFDENLLSLQDTDLLVRLNEKYGNAICVRKVLFIVHSENDRPRISSSANKFAGALSFYKKHKRKMNLSHRKYFLFYLKKLKRKKISLKTFVWLVPLNNFWPDFKYYLVSKLQSKN